MSTDKSTASPEIGARKKTGGTNASPRKPYQPPKLTVYGSIQKLTNATSMGASNDSGGTGTRKMRTCL